MQMKIKYLVLTINNTLIGRVTQFNVSCFILHYTLKWQKHIDYISKKASKAIGVMYRLKTYISRSSVINYISVYYKCTFYLWPFSIGIKD